MKYKVLLAGNSKRLITDFFIQMDSSFECLSSSMIFDDLKNHVNYFNPDVFVFCMRAESREDMITVASLHNVLIQNKIPYIAIGDSHGMEYLSKIMNGEPELFLTLPVTTSDLQERIVKYIQNMRSQQSINATSSVMTQASFSSSSTKDLMAQIDAELEMMEKGISPKASSAFSAVPRQPEIPGRRRILVIDDATIVHKTIKGHLDAEYEVATAISGKVALRFLQTKEVSLILLDYEMPEMDGPAVLTELRKDPYLAQIPVVFLTGINDVEKIKNALALKPQGYLLKPVDKSALISKIHELIG